MTTPPPPGASPPPGEGGAGPQYPSGPEVPVPRQPPPPGEPQKTSGFAIASLVFGIIGGVLFSIIFGLVALRRIRTRNLKGRGLAIAGLAVSGGWIALIGVILIVGLVTDAERDSSGRVQEAGSESVFDIQVGDCVNDVEETENEVSVEVTPCADPHDAEVIASFELRDGDYPGEQSVFRVADRRCVEELDEVAADVAGAEPFYYYPTDDSWDLDDRTVTCMALFREPRRGALAE